MQYIILNAVCAVNRRREMKRAHSRIHGTITLAATKEKQHTSHSVVQYTNSDNAAGCRSWDARCQSNPLIVRRDSIKRAFCMVAWRSGRGTNALYLTSQWYWCDITKLCVCACFLLSAHTIKINWSAWACWENPGEKTQFFFLSSAADAKWKGVWLHRESWESKRIAPLQHKRCDVVFPFADSVSARRQNYRGRVQWTTTRQRRVDTLEQVVRESFGAMPNLRDKTHNQTWSQTAAKIIRPSAI